MAGLMNLASLSRPVIHLFQILLQSLCKLKTFLDC
jgi:hypothetical protein